MKEPFLFSTRITRRHRILTSGSLLNTLQVIKGHILTLIPRKIVNQRLTVKTDYVADQCNNALASWNGGMDLEDDLEPPTTRTFNIVNILDLSTMPYSGNQLGDGDVDLASMDTNTSNLTKRGLELTPATSVDDNFKEPDVVPANQEEEGKEQKINSPP